MTGTQRGPVITHGGKIFMGLIFVVEGGNGKMAMKISTKISACTVHEKMYMYMYMYMYM